MNINEMKVSWILITLALLYWPSSQHDMPITKRSLSTITKRPEVSIVTAPQVQKKAASTPLPETNASKTDVHVHVGYLFLSLSWLFLIRLIDLLFHVA